MKDTDIIRERQIITGRVARPAIVLEEPNLVRIATEKKIISAGYRQAITLHAASTIFFSDCDAGGGFSAAHKVIIKCAMEDILKYLLLSRSVCIGAKRSANLKDSLILKNALINTGGFEDIHRIGEFLVRPSTFFTFLNSQTIVNSHSCVDNIRYKALHDHRYDPSCRCINFVGTKIFVGEDVLHYALSWPKMIYALYRKISLAYFSANPNNSHLIFKDVLEYYAGITIAADDRKKRVTEDHRNLARHIHMEHNPMPQ